MKLVNKSYVLENINFNTQPAILHGNGLSKMTFNSYTNYIPNKWSPESGCITCYDNNLDLSTLKVLSHKTFHTNLCTTKKTKIRRSNSYSYPLAPSEMSCMIKIPHAVLCSQRLVL